MFVGRENEINELARIIEDPSGQAVLIVGHWGFGKSAILDRLTEIPPKIPLRCANYYSLHYRLAKTDHVDTVMKSILDNVTEAAEIQKQSLANTPRRNKQIRALLNIAGLGDLLDSLLYKPEKPIRNQFIERLSLVSDKLNSCQRLLILIDPDKEMQPDSDQAWTQVVRQLPNQIKLIFAQRHEDVLATSTQFCSCSNVIKISGGDLGCLGQDTISELIDSYTNDVEYSKEALIAAIDRFRGHPYSTVAALELIKDGMSIDELPADPTPERIIEEQWKRIQSRGASVIRIFESYACLGIPLTDNTVDSISDVTREERMSLLVDDFLMSLLKSEGESKRIYHNILNDHILQQCDENTKHKRVNRAVGSVVNDSSIGFFDKVRLIEVWQNKEVFTEDAVKGFLQLMRENEGIKAYFARYIKSGKLVKELDHYGLFKDIPDVIKEGKSTKYPWWPEGAMLINVAEEVPEVVTRLIVDVCTDNISVYVCLLDAAVKIPFAMQKEVWGDLVNWLKDHQWHYLPDKYKAMAIEFVEKEAISEVLTFLEVVLCPIYAKTVHGVASVRPDEIVGLFSFHDLDTVVRPVIMRLTEEDLQKCILLLEELLSEAFRIETKNCGAILTHRCLAGEWRNAIEDNSKNVRAATHKDFLLVCLRDSLKRVIESNKDYGDDIITRYLSHEYPIFQRLAVQLISEFSDSFKEIAISMLTSSETLSDEVLYHELSVMLKTLFPVMEEGNQEAIVEAIFCGPDSIVIDKHVALVKEYQTDDLDVEACRKSYVDRWICVRLQLIEDYLRGDSKDNYNKLIEEHGKGKYPEFLYESGSEGGFVGRSASIAKEDWEKMLPSDCVDLMITWEPQEGDGTFLNKVCPVGLSDLFRGTLVLKWDQFRSEIERLINQSKYPCYTSALLTGLKEHYATISECGDNRIEIRDVLSFIKLSIRRWENIECAGNIFEYGDARDICTEALRLIEKITIWIDSERSIDSKDVFDGIRDTLIHLCDHDDTGDQLPLEMERLNPRRIIDNSICHVRPMALRELLRHAVVHAKVLGASSPRWGNSVRDKTNELVSNKDCLTVLAVLGETWRWLYWLDKDWCLERHSDIFSVGDPAGNNFYVTWSSYLFHINCYSDDDGPGYELMKPLYIAATNFSLDNPIVRDDLFDRQLAMRLAGFYYFDIEQYPTEDALNPLNHLFSFDPNKIQVYFAKTLWEACGNASDKQMRDKIWEKAIGLWRNRLEYVVEDCRNEYFSEEIESYVMHLSINGLNIRPGEVSDLLDQSIGIISPDERGHGSLDCVLEYLARKAKEDVSFSVSKLNRLFTTHRVGRYIDQQQIEEILSEACKSDSVQAKGEACVIVNLLGESGHYWAEKYLDNLRK